MKKKEKNYYSNIHINKNADFEGKKLSCSRKILV